MSSCGTGNPPNGTGHPHNHESGTPERIVKCVKMQRDLPGLDEPPAAKPLPLTHKRKLPR